MTSDLTVIVLAAGGGTRMKSGTAKVLHRVGGRSMVGHVLAAVRGLTPRRVVVVVGHQREQVGPHVQEVLPEATLAVQETQSGTGHAVRVAVEAVPEPERTGTVLVAYGDTPLLRTESLAALLDDHRESGRRLTLLTGELDDPTGYGRVLRDDDGAVTAVVEQKDGTPEQLAVREVNSGIYAFDAAWLAAALPRLRDDNAAGEYYLTDVVGLAHEEGLRVGAHVLDDVQQTEGANDRVQLAALGCELNRRVVEGWMREGVSVMDPATTWVDTDVVLRRDVTLLPGTQLLGATVVGEGAVVGPDTTLEDVEVGAGARVVRTHAQLAVVGEQAQVGPFAYLRPGAELAAGAKVGTFVEVKNSRLGAGAKVPHLSYVGDAEVGEGANLGAGTVVANYDGVEKHRTRIGRHARTASNTTFVAPVTVGDGAATGAGAVVRDDVPPGALALSAGPQRTLLGWVLRKRRGTAQARAAEEAGAPTGE